MWLGAWGGQAHDPLRGDVKSSIKSFMPQFAGCVVDEDKTAPSSEDPVFFWLDEEDAW